MNRHIGRLLTALGMLGISAAPLAREDKPWSGTGYVKPEATKSFYAERALAKRARKNAARLALVERGVLLSAHPV